MALVPDTFAAPKILLTPGFWLLAPLRDEQALVLRDPTRLGTSEALP